MKLKKVTFCNYRGYKYQEFILTDGLNTLIGSGDSGKSAFIKGLNFVIKNDQSGNIVSDEIKDGNGLIKKGEVCYVELELDCGSTVRRQRSRPKNLYILNGDEDNPLENFKQGVPEAVTALLNMNEVNLQTQFETHFMLNDNASTVAKTLNKMAGLDIIDDTTSNIDKIVRRITKRKDASDVNLKKYGEKILEFGFLKDMENDIIYIEELNNKLSTALEKRNSLCGAKEEIKKINKQIKDVEAQTNSEKVVVSLLELFSTLKDKASLKNKLDALGVNIHELTNYLKETADTSENTVLVNKLLQLFDTKKEAVKKYNSLLGFEETIDGCTKKLEECENIIKHENTGKELLKLFSKQSDSKEKCKKLGKIKEMIGDGETSLKKLTRSLKNLNKEIEGEACPLCGSSMKGEII